MKKDIKFEKLPSKIMVYAAQGTVLLPEGQIPLTFTNVDEIKFIERILRSTRLFGIAQSLELSDETIHFNTGCLARIVSFYELDDGYFILAKGVCRFDALKEMDAIYNFSLVDVDYTRYKQDLIMHADYDLAVDRKRLVTALEKYMEMMGVRIDPEEIEDTPDDKLVTALAMSGPFSFVEKQALIESVSLPEQCCIMTTLMEMALMNPTSTAH